MDYGIRNSLCCHSAGLKFDVAAITAFIYFISYLVTAHFFTSKQYASATAIISFLFISTVSFPYSNYTASFGIYNAFPFICYIKHVA